MRKMNTPEADAIGLLASGAMVGAAAVFLPWQLTIIACMVVGILALGSLLSKHHAGEADHIAHHRAQSG